MRELLFPAQWLYQSATFTRNWMYDHGLKRVHAVEKPVISVGNLTVGGTGKTPVTLALIEMLKSRGLSAGVVSRGYKRQESGVKNVTVTPGAAQEFGDEPVLIKTVHPEMPVVVGEKRIQAARKLLEETPVDFIICDDAFQHRSFKRDLNLLLLDCTETMKNYRPLPVGFGRESILPALRRADFLVLTKTNLAEPRQVEELITFLKDKSEKPVLLAPFGFSGFRSLKGEVRPTLKDKAYMVSGIAKPQTLDGTIAGKCELVKHKIFDDHHRYTNLEVEALLDEAAHLQARWIVTTAKDATKLSQFKSLAERLWIIDIRVQFEGDLKVLNADIDRLAGARS